jgi:hypothetical protein
MRDLKQLMMRFMCDQATSAGPATAASAPAAYSGLGDPSAASLVTPEDLESGQQQQLDEVLALAKAAADGAAMGAEEEEEEQAEDQQQTPDPMRAGEQLC